MAVRLEDVFLLCCSTQPLTTNAWKRTAREPLFSSSGQNSCLLQPCAHLWLMYTQSIQLNVTLCIQQLNIPHVKIKDKYEKANICATEQKKMPQNIHTIIVSAINSNAGHWCNGVAQMTDTDNDNVHLLLGQPKKMMHDPACKLFRHGSAKTWLRALNWTALQRCRWIIPDVYSQSSSLHRDWLRRYLTG